MNWKRLVLAFMVMIVLSALLITPALAAAPFIKYVGNPVLLKGSSQLVGACSVIRDGGIYKMWYTGLDENFYWYIGYATSPDETNWANYGTVLSKGSGWEANGVATPCVIKAGSTYMMWYTGVNTSMTTQIGYATSTNGTNWSKHGSVLTEGTDLEWDSLGVALPSVMNDGGIYKMWYTGRYNDSSTTGELRIGYATYNGSNWIKEPAAVLTKSLTSTDFDGKWVGACSVIPNGSGFIMYYTGFNSGSNGTQAQIGEAFSSNGTDWNKSASNPVLTVGSPVDWDEKGVAAPAVLVVSGATKMWFTGGNNALSFEIGYAEKAAEPLPVPASSSTGMAFMIGGLVLVMAAVIWGTRRYQNSRI
jgi:predicted GH43/DUF377 family glycosyl hydrolase